jgi:hypothetical protein
MTLVMRALVSVVMAAVAAVVPAVHGAGSEEIRAGGATIRIEIEDDGFAAGRGVILDWIRRSADIVAAYYGRFPLPSPRIVVEVEPGDGVGGGTSYGYGGGLIRVSVGRDVTEAALRRDWVLVHEMVHLALPSVDRDLHAWLAEGLATYVEGVARVRAGNRSETHFWSEMVRMMPRGLPGEGDRGLDRTHTWARTYWGGAMYCLLADVEIRKRTDGRKGLEDALRAILEASGGLVARWPIEQILRTGDAATGVPVLTELYDEMKHAPVRPDLERLWRDLGVERAGATVHLRDDAPLAPLRRALLH